MRPREYTNPWMDKQGDMRVIKKEPKGSRVRFLVARPRLSCIRYSLGTRYVEKGGGKSERGGGCEKRAVDETGGTR